MRRILDIHTEITNKSQAGFGGDHLLERLEQRMNRYREIVAIVAMILGIIFYSGYRSGSWPYIVVLAVLQIYLHSGSVSIDDRSYISLGTSAILPMILLCGTTPSMLISAFKGIYDGLKNRKAWRRTLFNAGQFALSTLAASLCFNKVSRLAGSTGLGLIVASGAATVAYVVCNIGLVRYLVAMIKGVTWWSEFKTSLQVNFLSSWSSGFIGIIFAFFVLRYELFGLLAFSALLIILSWLLQATAEVGAERALRKELEEELIIDEMTGAYNFRHLNNWLSEPTDEEVSLLFMDIDNFAVFNDTYGHAEGDRVLRLLVETIEGSIREGDQIVRYGGDEFVVFLRGMDAEKAKHVAERIMENLAKLKDPKWDDPVTVSLGIAARPQHSRDKRQLLLFADQAMYNAKNSGKNNIQIYRAGKDSA